MRWLALCVLGGVIPLVSQQAGSQQAVVAVPDTTGTVTGHVYLNDAGGPARLAQVALQPVEVKSDDRPWQERDKDAPFRLYRTGLDGGFRIEHVRPGSYYLVVKEPGYLSPFAQFTNAQLAHPTAEDQQKIAATLPLVTVLANNTATIEVHLVRGAVLSGAVVFDDGKPYPDQRVTVLQKTGGTWQPLMLANEGLTDDLGNFRITGLLEGDYLLRVNLVIDDLYASSLLGHGSSSSMTHYSLSYYSGDTERLRDAKPVHLDGSEEMSSAGITIPVSKLHAVSGAIVEAKTGRTVNSGKVTLVYADGGEDAVSTKVEADEPVFVMPFVPEGVYTIKVTDAADVTREEISNGAGTYPPFHTKETVVRKFGTVEQPLTVAGDVSGVNLAVTPVGKNVQ
jgi:hypothetical protein